MKSRTIVIDTEGQAWDVTVPATWRSPDGPLLEAVFPYGFNTINTLESYMVGMGSCPTLKAWSKLLANPEATAEKLIPTEVAGVAKEIRSGVQAVTA